MSFNLTICARCLTECGGDGSVDDCQSEEPIRLTPEEIAEQEELNRKKAVKRESRNFLKYGSFPVHESGLQVIELERVSKTAAIQEGFILSSDRFTVYLGDFYDFWDWPEEDEDEYVFYEEDFDTKTYSSFNRLLQVWRIKNE